MTKDQIYTKYLKDFYVNFSGGVAGYGWTKTLMKQEEKPWDSEYFHSIEYFDTFEEARIRAWEWTKKKIEIENILINKLRNNLINLKT